MFESVTTSPCAWANASILATSAGFAPNRLVNSSRLNAGARSRGFRAVFAGEPTIGGRYSALSPFGMVPAALMDVDLERLLAEAVRMAEACRGEANPGLELGLQLGDNWRDGRDKVAIDPNPGSFGLWAEQLIAESTGKQGKGLVPAPEERPRLPGHFESGRFACGSRKRTDGIGSRDQNYGLLRSE